MKDYKLVVLGVVDHAFSLKPKVHAVSAILKSLGYDYRLHEDPLWFGWPSKLISFVEKIPTLVGEATHVMCIDAADVVVLCEQDELMERWEAFNHPWVYNTEPHIWSPNSHTPEEYPTPDVYNRYFNAGACIGEIHHMIKWYTEWTQEPIKCKRGDQDWLANRYLWHYPDAMKLDTNCDLFQCMCGNDKHSEVSPGHLHNTLTGTDPAVIHYNGGTDITKPERRILWDHLI